MSRSVFVLLCIAVLVHAQGIVIDHTCTDLSAIPQVWITAVQDNWQSHYAHTSHGTQLTYGIEFVEDADPFYSVHVEDGYLPDTPGAYCVFDGQENSSYVTPDMYWESASGLNLTRDVLNNNPELDTSMWCWCCQCDYYSEAQVQAYLDAMTLLESEYPDVTFIYFTGNAQGTDSDGYARYQRNNQIRDYCAANNKVLYDFADIDCWWYNTSTSQWEQHTYSYNGTDVPAEHPQYYGNEYGHTTAESCINKGKAWWWMMSVLAGWGGTGVAQGESAVNGIPEISFGNPAGMPAVLSVEMPYSDQFSMSVFDSAGRMVRNLSSRMLDSGKHTFTVDGLSPGMYLISMNCGSSAVSRRMIVLN
ncbi:MAG: hypothetical protein CSA26_11690 [Desulfobacterales bacterium]|nr:MAG: hypothetical protein CSA26_11690 [Desulfobacterales bacterium]